MESSQFSLRLRRWLEDNNCSQSDLAYATGLSGATISAWLRGNVQGAKIDSLHSLANVTGINMYVWISDITGVPYTGTAEVRLSQADSRTEIERLENELKNLKRRIS